VSRDVVEIRVFPLVSIAYGAVNLLLCPRIAHRLSQIVTDVYFLNLPGTYINISKPKRINVAQVKIVQVLKAKSIMKKLLQYVMAQSCEFPVSSI